MKKLIGVMVGFFIGLTVEAEWLYVDGFPWIWSDAHQSWEYSLNKKIPLWSTGSEFAYSLGWDGDLRVMVEEGSPKLIHLQDDQIVLSYKFNGLSGMWIQLGEGLESESIYANYNIAYHDYVNVVSFFVSEAVEQPTLSFSLVLEFTDPNTGRYTLQGIFPDRETEPSGFYSSSGEFQM